VSIRDQEKITNKRDHRKREKNTKNRKENSKNRDTLGTGYNNVKT
jgi:hypothetical protein